MYVCMLYTYCIHTVHTHTHTHLILYTHIHASLSPSLCIFFSFPVQLSEHLERDSVGTTPKTDIVHR